MRPLDGVRVLDFTTLLPGPLATLILAEAGAEVLKIERPDGGDEMRRYPPAFSADGANFALLNRAKRSLAIDLKDPAGVAKVKALAATAQVVVEQFRPGVMDRLGIGWEALRAVNPRLVYCAITGYGQDGPKAMVAAHDLNYIADTGLAALAADGAGAPVLPPGLIADIGAGSFPAVLNILLALRRAEATGEGTKLDIAMTDGLFAWQYWAQGMVQTGAGVPRPGGELVTGGSPRYRLYRCACGRFLAAAPLEQRFWENFCAAIGLPEAVRDDARDPAATARAVADIVARRTAADWTDVLAGKDVCVNVVRTVEEALADPHFRGRGLFAREVVDGGRRMAALPVPVHPGFRAAETAIPYPRLGEANAMLEDL